MGSRSLLDLPPLRTVAYSTEDIRALHVTGMCYPARTRIQMLCKRPMDVLEGRGGILIRVQRINVQRLTLLGQTQDKLVAGEGLRHLIDDCWIVLKEAPKIMAGHTDAPLWSSPLVSTSPLIIRPAALPMQ